MCFLIHANVPFTLTDLVQSISNTTIVFIQKTLGKFVDYERTASNFSVNYTKKPHFLATFPDFSLLIIISIFLTYTLRPFDISAPFKRLASLSNSQMTH